MRFWIARVGAALWLTAILVGSLAPADDVQGAYVVPDFWVHAAGYFGLAVLFMLSQRRPRLVLSAAAAVGVGVVVELLQSTTTDRSASLLDVLGNAVGALLAAGLFWVRRRVTN